MPTPRSRHHQSRVLAALLGSALVLLAGCAGTTSGGAAASRAGDENFTILKASDISWGALNPARGSAGPRAADLWGDRTTGDATGFLVRFADGFSSPPHIHNTTYRGIVIEGLIHNDDPDAEELWMPPGSYWMQPAGEVHITSAKGEGRLAYIEIQNGPYLVQPPEEASDNGERSINVHPTNLVWLDASTSRFIQLPEGDAAAAGARVAFLWGDPQDDRPSGSLVALPAGITASLQSDDTHARLVVIKGHVRLQPPGSDDPAAIGPGSLIESRGQDTTRITFSTEDGSWLYVRNSGSFELEVSEKP